MQAWPVIPGGSSPPTRGTPLLPVVLQIPGRFIPAHAGNTKSPMSPVPSLTVHPRPRGEHMLDIPTLSRACGSSPPTRGTRQHRAVCHTPPRFIPAHAGNTQPAFSCKRLAPVHPRPRGEHLCSPRYLLPCRGSSPPTRGTLSFFEPFCLTPPVHPRPRGEHHELISAKGKAVGSSPPTRGTPLAPRRIDRRIRFIPAHAGNTPTDCCGINGRTVHPRPRGEHFSAFIGHPK